MKKLILSASFAFALLTTSNTFAQQGFGTNQPDKSAAVDIVSSKRGLLIPRISIEDLDKAAPVSNPAHSLFVFNTNATTGQGFYYWEKANPTSDVDFSGKWVRFTSSVNEKDVIVAAGENVKVNPTISTDGLTTTYTVGVQGGTENGQVLVTKVDGATTTTEWVNPADFIQGINGITVEQVTDPTTGIVENVVKLGGTLTEDTTIITDGNKVMIQGLSQVTDMTDQVVAVGHYQTGEVKVATPGQIVSNTLTDGSGTTAVYDATTGKNQVDLGGKLTKPAVIETEGANTIAITGLNEVATADLTTNDKIVIMGNDGVLKITSRTSLFDAKDLTLGDGLTFEAGIDANDGVGAVLKATKIEIKDNSVTAEKLLAENPAGATDPLAGKVATADANGNVTYEAITPASLRDKKTLTGDGITVTAGTTVGTDSSVADALLADVTLGIANGAVTTAKLADGAVTNQKLADGAVSSDKMTSFTDDNGTTTPVAAGHVPVADGAGNVTYQNVATAIGQDLTTDGKIVIGNNTSTTQTLADAVLVATQLSIKENSLTAAEIATGAVTSDEILDGTIKTVDIESAGNSKVLVTAADGTVTWIDQADLANKDSYTFTAPLSKDAGAANATGGLDYAVTITNANGTTAGVVKEAATNPTVRIADGVLSVDADHTTLAGDVTGPLSATKVEAIQGTAVSATAPDATNNVLKYDGTAWTPAQLQGSDIAGKAITSTSLTVSSDGATAALKDVTINITPGTAEGQILTTVNTAAAGDPAVLSTNWATPNSLVAVDNGLKKVSNDVIHLGGALKEVTEIKTSADHTLAISGLQAATETNKVVVSEGTTGVLRTVERVVEGTNANVVNNTGYSFYTPEVVLNITLPATGDVTVEFPAAASAVGQVINIKIANTTESHTGYLNVLDTYGSMPYQGWIVKSNGSAWVIVGRN